MARVERPTVVSERVARDEREREERLALQRWQDEQARRGARRFLSEEQW